MPMGLCESLAIWYSYINAILSSILDQLKYLAIINNILLHSLKHGHLKYLKNLLEVLLKYGLKLLARKCQLLGTELHYIANTIFIKDNRVWIKPSKTGLKAIQN